MTLEEIAELADGTVRGDGAVVVAAPASVDSRTVEPGGLFVAVVGERVDGHDYVDRAMGAGAAAVLCARPVEAPCVVVEDPVEALAVIAASVRTSLDDCVVVGVTGSQGKTGTKDLLARLLGRLGPTVATKGSMNNELGLPLTILRTDATTRFLVLEMGARGIGHIAELCRVARPDVGVVLNVGTAHVGEFGSRENIAVAKGELVAALPPDGTAVLNADDPFVAAMAGRTAAQVVTFGRSDEATVRVSDVRVAPAGATSFTMHAGGDSLPVELGLLGEHQADNAAAAAAVALRLGLGPDEVVEVLDAAVLDSSWRMERHVRDDGVVVVNDAYNANPASVATAVRTLAAMGQEAAGRSVAVLGEMGELGATSAAAHHDVGSLAARLGIDQLVVVGDSAAGIHRGALDEGGATTSTLVDDADAATRWLRAQVRPGDVVLVKASRVVGLERVADALTHRGGDTAPRTESKEAVEERDQAR